MQLSAALQRRKPRCQRGITLLESLVALTILAVAVLAMLGVQLRTLVEARTSAHRAHAVRLIEDLAERIQANPQGPANADAYVGGFDAAAGDTARCDSRACNPTELASWDIAEWRDTVAQNLPLGRAAVFAVAERAESLPPMRRQLGVVIGWRANERRTEGTSEAQSLAQREPIEVDLGGAAVECPVDFVCHVGYVQL